MSEVKRYHLTEAGLVEGVALGRLNVVLAADYEVARVREHELQQRLTAADERADVLVGLLRDMRKGDHAMISSFYGRIDAALKPAEVSDEPCEFCKGWGFRANSETGADEGCGACNGTGSTPSEDQP